MTTQCITPLAAAAPRLRDVFIDRIRAKHYAYRTGKTYWRWIRAYCRHFPGQHPRGLQPVHIEAFLSHLATARHVSARPMRKTGTHQRQMLDCGVCDPDAFDAWLARRGWSRILGLLREAMPRKCSLRWVQE